MKTTHKAPLLQLLLSLFIILNSGCRDTRVPNQAVAQVGGAVLTLNDLQDQFPAEYKHIIRREQYLDFIKRWIDDEILYQEAQRQKLQKNPNLQRKLLELRKKVMVDEYLSELSRSYAYAPDENTIRDYYLAHSAEFVRREAEVKFAEIIVKDEKLAWQITGKINIGNFMILQKQHSVYQTNQNSDDIPFRKFTEVDTCIAEETFSTKIGGITSPLKCGDNYHIVRIIDKQGPGSTKLLPQVEEEITDLLISKRRKKYLENKINELKEGIFITHNLDLIPAPEQQKPQQMEGSEEQGKE